MHQFPARLRLATILRFALCFALAAAVLPLSPREASASGTWILSGRVTNASTGEPAAAVQYMVFQFDAGDAYATQADWRWTENDGRYEVSVNKRYAIIYFRGRSEGSGDMYYSEYYKGVRVTTPVWTESIPTDTRVSLAGPAGGATRVHGSDGQRVDLGTHALTPAPKPYGAITGQVTERITGVGMPVDVYVWRYDQIAGRWSRTGWAGATLTHASDRLSGNYNLVGTAQSPLTGDIRLEFSWNATNKSRFYPDSDTVDGGMTLHLDSGQTVTGVNQTIPMLSKIRGRVVDASTGRGIPRTDVEYFYWSERWHEWDNGIATTDSNGRYLLGDYGLPAGRYRIRAVIPNPASSTNTPKFYYYGQTRTFSTAREVTLASDTIVDDIDILIGGDPEVFGQAENAQGVPQSDIAATAYLKTSTGWSYAGSTYTDSAGKYRLDVGKAGTYTVRFRDTAGTTKTSDDAVTYLGSTTLAQARTVTVGTSGAKLARTQRVALAASPRASRISATGAAASAIQSSRSAFASGEATCAVLVGEGRQEEAMCSAGLAGAVDGPILFTGAKRVNKTMLRELKRLGVQKVYVVGNGAGVSYSQEGLLRALGFKVERVWGADRYGVSAAVASKIGKLSGVKPTTPVFLVNGSSASDALSVGPIAYDQAAPIVYVTSTATPATVRSALTRLGVTRVFAVGSGALVPGAALSGLTSSGVRYTRLATDPNRFTRAAQFVTTAEKLGWTDVSTVGLTSASDFSGAAASAPALARRGGVMLLSGWSALPSATTSAIRARSSQIDGIKVFATPTWIRSSAMIQAGSQ